MFVINYFFLWILLSHLEVAGMQPIGSENAFGFIFPPNWLFLVNSILTVAEYIVLTTYFPISRKSKWK